MNLRVPGGLAGKVILLVGMFGFVMGGLLTYRYIYSAEIALSDAQERFTNRAFDLASKLMADLSAVSAVVDKAGRFVQAANPDQRTLLILLRSIVEGDERIFGSAAAFAPHAFVPDRKAYAPYLCKKDGALTLVDLGTDEYDYFSKDWYREPARKGEPEWTEPYFDRGGGEEMMITYSAPFFYNDGARNPKVRGVITADVSIDRLTRQLHAFRAEENGFSFLISASGTFLVPPKGPLSTARSIFDASYEHGLKERRAVGTKMLSEASGFMDIGTALTDEPAYLAFAGVPAAGWSLAIVLPKRELLDQVANLYRTGAIVTAGAVAILLAVVLVVVHHITRPLREMVAATKRIAGGDLDTAVPEIRTGDEIGDLAEAFRRMTEDLKKYIRDLTETTALNERMESELDIAARIQASLLPSSFPAFPDRDDIDLFGIMEPARYVGGDFYDFVLIDDDRLCIAIGDVSDKGVSAAMFTAAAIYLIRAAARSGSEPHEILRLVNEQICSGNDAGVFVTVFCGILDLKSGEFRYSNAGHEPPMVRRPGAEIDELPVPSGPALGLMEDAIFTTKSIRLEADCGIVAYTDGITEARDEDDTMYTEDRLKRVLMSATAADAESLVKALLKDLKEFRGSAGSFDDVTLLALNRR